MPNNKYANLHEYLLATRLRRWELAAVLSVTRFQVTGLLYPDRYSVRVTDEMAERIAKLLNQPVSVVRSMYGPQTRKTAKNNRADRLEVA